MDDIFQESIRDVIQCFTYGATIFLKEVPDTRRFGVAEIHGPRIISIEEKPKVPKSNFTVIGLYIYDADVFDIIKTLKPSGRNELEITDLNNEYIRKRMMNFSILGGYWSRTLKIVRYSPRILSTSLVVPLHYYSDAGTFDCLLKASIMIQKYRL